MVTLNMNQNRCNWPWLYVVHWTYPDSYGLNVTAVEVMARLSHLSLPKSRYFLMSKSSPSLFHSLSAVSKQYNSFIMD